MGAEGGKIAGSVKGRKWFGGGGGGGIFKENRWERKQGEK